MIGFKEREMNDREWLGVVFALEVRVWGSAAVLLLYWVSYVRLHCFLGFLPGSRSLCNYLHL